VTGAAGFLGSHLVDRLLAEGFEVVGLDNLMTGDLSNLENARRDPHFHFEIGDVREPLGVYAELVFNFACPASPVHYQHDPYATLTTSVIGAQRVIEMARGRPCTIVHASTSEVYGDPLVHPQPESYWGNVNPIGERSCYDEGKRCAETLFNDAHRRWKLDVRLLRLFNTYGPRMALDDGRVVSNFSVQALRGLPVTIFGDGLQSRSFCYVDDLIEGIFRAAICEPFSGPVNLGNPGEFTILELAERVIQATGSNSTLIYKPAPSDDPKRRQPDISRAQTLLGFTPKTALKEGLALTIEDFRSRVDALRDQRIAEADSARSTHPSEVVTMRSDERAGDLARAIENLMQDASACGDAHRIGDQMVASERFISFIDKLGRLVPVLGGGSDGESIETDREAARILDELARLIQQLSTAQRVPDTIKIADLLEYETVPLLKRLRDRVTA
jgi:UDP-glucuronate decarboxylase